MNKAQRKELQKILDQLEPMIHEINALQNDEQEKFDNLPEGLWFLARAECPRGL